VGVGNEFRRDDGAGLIVARRVAALKLPSLEVAESSGEGASLMDLWNGADQVFLADAARSGAPPGRVFRFDASAGPVPTSFFSYTTHAFSVAEAVETARALGRLPARVIVYGVEGKDFAHGEGLSSCVRDALDAIIAALFQDLSHGTATPENQES
jgi:hydrogenase maturation protease